THLARVCFQCDLRLHPVTMDSPDHSRFLLCNNCVSQTAVVQCLDQGLFLCQMCVSNANVTSRFLLCNTSSNISGYGCPPDLDLDSSSSSSSSSFIDRNWGFPFVSLPLNNGDSSSSSGIFQNFDNYTKKYRDQQVQMIQPEYLDIPKDSSCFGFNCYEIKDIENVLLNSFDVDEAVLGLKEYFPMEELILTGQLNDEITKHSAETTTEIISSSSSGMSSVIHKDYNNDALANASCEDYSKNQMIGSKAKEETNNNNIIGTFPNALVQLDCGPSQLILTDAMLPWEDQRRSSHVYTPQERLEAVKRYFAKKKKRKFGKQIRYESRKSTADTKRRMKGRFTKAGAEYDYDPRANNNKD
ncbi:hypothetical protein EUTSA_v10009385mg, partial [Eutrema salsugineum]